MNSLSSYSDIYCGCISTLIFVILIYRINYPSIDKTPAEVIIIGSYPSGIAVDSINDHLYWTDIGRGSIFRSNIDGLNTITILNNIYSLVIELDIRNGYGLRDALSSIVYY